MARERFRRELRERKFVSDFIYTLSSKLPFSELPYFLDKIDKIFKRDGFINTEADARLKGYLLQLSAKSELSTAEFIECFDKMLRSYSWEKRLSLLPRVVMFRAAETQQEVEELPSYDENSLRPSRVE